VLTPVYAWFTKGCAAPELKEAKALINELSTPSTMLLLPGRGRIARFRNFDDAQKTSRRYPTGISDCVPRFRHFTMGRHRGSQPGEAELDAENRGGIDRYQADRHVCRPGQRLTIIRSFRQWRAKCLQLSTARKLVAFWKRRCPALHQPLR
jgi:hypothetical protein